jgi:hypothetical protein
LQALSRTSLALLAVGAFTVATLVGLLFASLQDSDESFTVTANATTTVPRAPAGSAPAASSVLTLPPGSAVSLPAAGDGQPSPGEGEGAPAADSETGPSGQPAQVGSGVVFESLRNDQPKFSQYADVPSAQLDLDALTEAAPRPDNGTVGDGQFRLACEYSHFSYDDPIVFPGEPGRSHLHMFFGNTLVDAYTTTETLVDSGGGTCNGFELNRSGYWVPALVDGSGNAVVPDAIILYYKSKDVANVQAMPQGLKMVAGNTGAETFSASHQLHWACGGSGGEYNMTNRIPDCGGDLINATVVFPNCWDGVNLDAADHLSHMAYVAEEQSCPASHPVRLPQISILLYFPGTGSVEGWHLSSDRKSGFNTGPGATLHADWWGGWNDQAIQLWTNGCMRAARNCSYGQTGTDRQLASLNALQVYEGPNLLALPEGSYPPS